MLGEDETLNFVSEIAKAYPIAQQNCEDNQKWKDFRAALGGLSPGIAEDWDQKVDCMAFEANLTDMNLDSETW